MATGMAGGVWVPLSVLLCVAALRGAALDGGPSLRRRARACEGLLYFGFFALRFWEIWLVVGGVSEAYRALMARRGASPSESGLHVSWLSGLLGGRPLDLKDAQWHEFRDGLAALSAGATLHLALGFAARRAARLRAARDAVLLRALVDAACGLALVIYLHEADALKVLFFSGLGFALSRALSCSRLLPAAMWLYCLSLLLANDRYGGLRLPEWVPSWLPGLAAWAALLDARRGPLAWHHSFNLVVLRLLSHALDGWWAQQQQQDNKQEQEQHKEQGQQRKHQDQHKRSSEALSEAARSAEAQPAWVYDSLLVFYGYVLYPPLYIAGPTMSFNNFASHLAVPQRTYSGAGKARYAVLRFCAVLLLFEVLGHYFYVGAIAYMAFRVREGGEPLLVHLTRMEAMPVVLYSYVALIFLWFKFLLIWRFFRLWAVLDDVEPVENMERCINNNYTVAGFWRSWHRSFNRWLLRYVYIPLGGGQGSPWRKAFNVLVVFTFVGFWHDIKPELFAWAWLLSLFFLPEIVAERLGRVPALRRHLDARPVLAGLLTALGGACSIVMLKVANIVGYSTGLEGAALLAPAVSTPRGALFVLEYFLTLVVAVSCMTLIEACRTEASGGSSSYRVGGSSSSGSKTS